MIFSRNWVFNTLLVGSVFFFTAISAQGLFAQQSDTPAFDRVKQLFEEGKVFTAQFSHEYNDSFTGESQRTDGQIWIGKNRYKIEGDLQQVVVDGDFSTVYDGSKNRVIISDYVEEEDDFAPSRMLQGVQDDFTAREELLSSGETKITLTSTDVFSVFFEVFIYVSADGIPLRIEAIDQADNELLTGFENGRFIDETEDLFEVKVPENAELIDLRLDAR